MPTVRAWLPALALVFVFVFVFVLGGGGCGGLYSAVVDDHGTEPGGTLHASVDGVAADVPALASGDPLTISASSANLVVSIVCGEDATGRAAVTVLAVAGGTIELAITAAGRTQLQLHTGGKSCIADTGTVQLATLADGTISGTFSATGHEGAAMTACAPEGTLTGIPLQAP